MGPDRSTSSSQIDKINYGRSFNILEAAKVQKYLESLSHEDILKDRLSNFKNISNKIDKKNVDKFIIMLTNLYQSVTTKGLSTYEITSYIVNTVNSFDDDVRNILIKEIENYFSIFHLDYSNSQIHSPALDEREKEVLNVINYGKDSKVKDYYSSETNADDHDLKPYNTAELLNQASASKTREEQSRSVVNNNITDLSKENPSLSVILLNNDSLRGGVKNSLELSTFFNLIPTLEYAKSYPYFNATFVLPSISKQDTKSVFKTATLNQFLFGGVENDKKTQNFRNFEGEIFKDKNKLGVKTNLSVFTTPQTVVNMDEKIGHNNILSSDKKRLRITNVHDQTRPFMTLKDFTLDIAPTKGMMSFKTGKLSLILHDRTRMVDIAPFIKPDLFGAFGAEIVVEYGWVHNESQSTKKRVSDISKNPIGDFIDSSRCIEKYMVVNSQFTIENNGQVNINLSIAMKGPIDIRQTEIFADATKSVDRGILQGAINLYNARISSLDSKNNTGFSFSSLNGSMTNLYAKKNLSKNDLKNIARVQKLLRKVIKNINRPILKIKSGDLDEKEVIFSPSSGRESIVSSEENKKLFRDFYKIDASSTLLVKENLDKLKSIARAINNLNRIINNFKKIDDERKEEQRSFVDDLVGGTKYHDMFFDKSLIDVIQNNNSNLSITKSDYVSLGTIISSLIGTHMVPTNRYDEVQIIFHTINKKAGIASNYKSNDSNKNIYTLNIASLLIKRSYLESYLEKIFETQTRLTLESLISQIVTKFIMSKDNPCYGLNTLYTRRKFDSPVKPQKKVKEKDIRKKLNEIYYGQDTELYDDDPQFIPPSIHLTFDALTSRENKELTICRITVYDRNNNPYQSICDLYNKTFLEKSKGIRVIRQTLKELESKKLKKEEEKIKKAKVLRFIKKLTEGPDAIFIREESGSEVFYRFRTGFGFDDLKSKYKKIIPSATFATQNTSLINASVATVNEGKLNTVYITRQDRNNTAEINNQVIVDMPLRILPAQASIEMFGCPWVNFGQYIFLDFETGTTIDNTYAVTGVKHTISPGKFTTSVSLSYGDVYGKYEGVADTFNNALNKFVAPEEEPDASSSSGEAKKSLSESVAINEDAKEAKRLRRIKRALRQHDLRKRARSDEPIEEKEPTEEPQVLSISPIAAPEAQSPRVVPTTPEDLAEKQAQSRQQRRHRSSSVVETHEFDIYNLLFNYKVDPSSFMLSVYHVYGKSIERFLKTFKIYLLDSDGKQKLLIDEDTYVDGDLRRTLFVIQKIIDKENYTRYTQKKGRLGPYKKLEIILSNKDDIDKPINLDFFVIQNPKSGSGNEIQSFFKYDLQYSKDKKFITEEGIVSVDSAPYVSFFWNVSIDSDGNIKSSFNDLALEDLYGKYNQCPIFEVGGPVDKNEVSLNIKKIINKKNIDANTSNLENNSILSLSYRSKESKSSDSYNVINHKHIISKKGVTHYDLNEFLYQINLIRFAHFFNEKDEDLYFDKYGEDYSIMDRASVFKRKDPSDVENITIFEEYLLKRNFNFRPEYRNRDLNNPEHNFIPKIKISRN